MKHIESSDHEPGGWEFTDKEEEELEQQAISNAIEDWTNFDFECIVPHVIKLMNSVNMGEKINFELEAKEMYVSFVKHISLGSGVFEHSWIEGEVDRLKDELIIDRKYGERDD